MSFLFIAVGIWAAAMVAWFMVSKYVKSSDVDRVKARLLGKEKSAPKKKAKKGEAGEPQVLTRTTETGNKLAQLLVEKYQLGPKLAMLIEQAGLN